MTVPSKVLSDMRRAGMTHVVAGYATPSAEQSARLDCTVKPHPFYIGGTSERDAWDRFVTMRERVKAGIFDGMICVETGGIK